MSRRHQGFRSHATDLSNLDIGCSPAEIGREGVGNAPTQ